MGIPKRTTIKKVLVQHFEFQVPVSTIDRELRLPTGTARTIVLASLACDNTQSSEQVQKELRRWDN